MKRLHLLAFAAAWLIFLMLCSCGVLAADNKSADNRNVDALTIISTSN